MKILLVIHGWLGDTLIAQQAAEHLVKELNCTVDMFIGFPQTILLLKQNPYINNIIVSDIVGPIPDYNHLVSQYDDVRVLQPYKGKVPLTIHNQLSLGVKNPSLGYTVYTVPEIDKFVSNTLNEITNGKLNIGICLTWKTDKGALYNTDNLIKELSLDYNIFPIGLPPEIGQRQSGREKDSEVLYATNASYCKYLDLVIGSEGGMTNLAAGVGGRVLYTTDFTEWLAGPNGAYKHQTPTEILGPLAYFPNANHILLKSDISPDMYISKIKVQLSHIK